MNVDRELTRTVVPGNGALRIAQIAPLYEAVPPEGYGGTERVIAALCDGLTDLGHDVTLFAARGSRTRARLEACGGLPLRTRMSRREMVDLAPHLHLQMLAEVFRRASEYDVIHSHVDIWTLPFARLVDTPTLVTLHGRLDVDHVRATLRLHPDAPLVSISDHQRQAVADLELNWAATVHNGLDLSAYSNHPRQPQGYLAFAGRINAEKGPAFAVDVARRSGRRLRVAAKVDPFDVEYFEQEIEPLFADNDVDFLGELHECDKPAFFAGASATLFPSDWPEPFGLVMIESMAAGTPVVALRRGSVPEIIKDGVTGFVCETVDDMVDAVHRVESIDPADCRQHAAKFSGAAMSSRYEAVYRDLARRTADAPSSDTHIGASSFQPLQHTP
jgi:glycosyltransferase involved in cell wall biosynthesis